MRRGEDEGALLDELASFYADVDAAFATTSCPATSECCRFARTGREPYVTSLEMAMVDRALARRGGSFPQGPKPLHEERRELPVLKEERACPFLSKERRCSIYEARPLGCRTFFCERGTTEGRPVKHKELLAFVNRLKDLAQRHTPGGDEGRPFTRALAIQRQNRAGARKPSNGRRGP